MSIHVQVNNLLRIKAANVCPNQYLEVFKGFLGCLRVQMVVHYSVLVENPFPKGYIEQLL